MSPATPVLLGTVPDGNHTWRYGMVLPRVDYALGPSWSLVQSTCIASAPCGHAEMYCYQKSPTGRVRHGDPTPCVPSLWELRISEKLFSGLGPVFPENLSPSRELVAACFY